MRYRYRRRRSATGSGKLAYPVAAFLIVFSVIVQAMSVIIPVLCLAGCAVGIYYLSRHISQRKAEKEALYRELQVPEPKLALHQAKRPGEHGSPEEIRVYEALKQFLSAYDTYLCAVEKLHWMHKRCEAQSKLEMETDFSEEQFQTQERAIKLEERHCCEKALSSPEAFYPGRPRKFFDNLSRHLVAVEDPLVSHFLCGIPVYTVRGSCAEMVYFTPWYLLFFDRNNLSFTIEDYESLCFEAETFTVKKDDSFCVNDEIAFQVWEHQRKDGGPDLRYRDNTCTTYLYRGRATFSCRNHTWSMDFPNKSSVENLEKSLREFLNAKPLPPLKRIGEKAVSMPQKSQTPASFVKTAEPSVEPLKIMEDRSPPVLEVSEGVSLGKTSARIYTPQELAEEYRRLLSPGAILHHRTLGAGILTRMEPDKGYLYVRFGDEEKKFLYPKAIQQGYFTMVEPLQETSIEPNI